MLRYISNLQLSRCLGYHEVIDFNSKLKLATSLLHCYKESLHFNQGQLSTDIMNNDPYALLTAHILYDIWIETKDAIFLKDACVVLEFALSYSLAIERAPII
ncbi:hypothetical protein LSTR_LSTR016077 [Laodelphax striatellus]|uniref:Uncharacterized protein n=1 Tax=Laodelphax striatellus TaxID=195883 RepID=A0A482X7I5_LAOST|nr:hypothetical protein LSTR_LSTR016077 [Laodelphax striatellus]